MNLTHVSSLKEIFVSNLKDQFYLKNKKKKYSLESQMQK